MYKPMSHKTNCHLLDIVNFAVDLITYVFVGVSLAGNQDILESEPMECFRFLVN